MGKAMKDEGDAMSEKPTVTARERERATLILSAHTGAEPTYLSLHCSSTVDAMLAFAAESAPYAAELRNDRDDWRSVALQLGELLTPNGPDQYYNMTPGRWISWAKSVVSESAADDRRDAERKEYVHIGTMLELDDDTKTKIVDWNDARYSVAGGTKIYAAIAERTGGK